MKKLLLVALVSFVSTSFASHSAFIVGNPQQCYDRCKTGPQQGFTYTVVKRAIDGRWENDGGICYCRTDGLLELQHLYRDKPARPGARNTRHGLTYLEYIFNNF